MRKHHPVPRATSLDEPCAPNSGGDLNFSSPPSIWMCPLVKIWMCPPQNLDVPPLSSGCVSPPLLHPGKEEEVTHGRNNNRGGVINSSPPSALLFPQGRGYKVFPPPQKTFLLPWGSPGMEGTPLQCLATPSFWGTPPGGFLGGAASTAGGILVPWGGYRQLPTPSPLLLPPP